MLFLLQEFFQQQVITDNGLQPMIRIRDKNRMQETFWHPLHFVEWVHRVRDYEGDETMKELIDPINPWESYEETEIPENSLETSRITINLTPIRKQLNESVFQLSLSESLFEAIDESPQKYEEMKVCLVQMEVAAKTLGKLCNKHENQEVSEYVSKSLVKMTAIIKTLRDTLTFNQNIAKNVENDKNDDKTGEACVQEGAKSVRFNLH